MAHEVPPSLVFLHSFKLVLHVLGNETCLMHFVGRLNLTRVARLCDSSC